MGNNAIAGGVAATCCKSSGLPRSGPEVPRQRPLRTESEGVFSSFGFDPWERQELLNQLPWPCPAYPRRMAVRGRGRRALEIISMASVVTDLIDELR